ncbi:MAG: 50S ribosomal protein L3 [Candidatus Buchananbacteria bacterium RBG_13_36_9]|uniref:Large ribosomal subunit protein uL3 n=1 Tax=Candidatus Buchananbacteria bacterium RBG_13_36_9 TaxID=1797530 RepID=A0A1G1XMX2_9BACT|nr:MAG: 50S ribosomal protein L3 [Candidatus Buchananbacteria bacterium RBG_13_36_9]
MKYILGKKLEMSEKFKADGEVIPVTIVSAGPCFISQIKTMEKDGYKSVQVGFGQKRKLNKSAQGHLKNLPAARYLREFLIDEQDKSEYKKGQEIKVDVFNQGEKVKVIGTSKGRGFQGVVKRHGFSGAPKTHGTKDQLRHSGSVGAKGVAHTFKGTKMGGHMGADRVTISNLEIIDIDPAKNLLYIKGAIPGSRNGLVEISAPGVMKLEMKETKKDEQSKVASQNLDLAQKEEKIDEPAAVENKK